MARLTLSLLGPFQIVLDGQPVPAPLWAKTQALLAYLAAEAARLQLGPVAHRREVLAGLLWPDQPDEAARHSLREALHQLRLALGAEASHLLLITPQTVQLNLAADCVVDVTEFVALIGACRAHAHRCEATCRPCIERLQRAATLYRGHFLAGFFLKDSVPYEEWALVLREQLARQALAAFHTLAEHYALQGQVEQLEQIARRQIELDPLAEDAHRQLMRAWSWSGRRNAALAHYEALRRTLASELNAPPEEETSALATQVKASLLPPLRSPYLHNWPSYARLTSFVGREDELARIATHLGSPDVCLLTILGPGGVGKSRLALQAAAQEAYAFRDGACWVPLDTVDAPELVVPAIAAALRLALSGPVEPLVQLTDWLREREMLLVLDGCERCVQAAPLLADLAAACPQVRILVTSRQSLHVRGERQFPVAPLALPDLSGLPQVANGVGALPSSPAVALFADRAQAVRPDFRLTHENVVAVAEICSRVDGLPLAIELAAGHVRALSPQTMLSHLSSQLALLTDGPSDLPARQRTMRASIEWSHALLGPADQVLFRRLSVFAGGCAPEAVEAVGVDDSLVALVASDVQGGIESLLDRHLLYSSESDGSIRLGMYEPIREYAQECLAISGEGPAICRKHADYYADWQGRHYQELDRMEVELSNLRAAMRWSLTSSHAEPGLRIAHHLWFWSSRSAEWRYWLDELLRSPGAQSLTQARVALVFAAALQVLLQGDYARCQALRDEHRALAEAMNDPFERNISLYLSGYLCMARQDYQGAASVFAEGLAWEARAGNPFMVAMFESGLGNNWLLLRDHDRAEAALRRAWEGFAGIGFQFGAIETLTSLGYVALEKQEYGRARELLTQAISQARAIGFRSSLPDCLNGLAGIAVQQGDLPRAARLYGAAQELAQRFGSPSHEPPLMVIRDRHLAVLRQILAPTDLECAWQEGRQMSLDEALAYGLEATCA
jgi:predicted ATPase/DNA-binding SARP family transcriptional activator